MKQAHTQRRKVGFTLLELLMVVVIIAILASIALPQYIRAAEKARATEALTALGAIRQAEFRYKALHTNSAYTNVANQLDVEMANSNNPGAGLVSFGNVAITVVGGGNTIATGKAIYTRTSGNYAGQTVGIQFGTGTICGNLEALGLTTTNCNAD